MNVRKEIITHEWNYDDGIHTQSYTLKTTRRYKALSGFSSFISYVIYNAKRFSRNNYTKIYKRAGKEYGFPKCCIKSFCTIDVDDRTKNQLKATSNYGFVPCTKHADKIVAGEITIDDIIGKRKNGQKFGIE